ncbi:uncharacterized protein LOC123192558 [Mangifera indica]|uniref:uncharacterized protein LOC123192558 n=1 Tax=Mangifera indica TaxID=29780 RepID=UPI001CFA67B7|nr:uncharacterized protein LOC123192558 [Mangifera indica]
MKSLSGVGVGLSVIFGCLVLALVAELYYLLWWKKRLTGREIENDYSNPAREFLSMFCWRKPSNSLRHSALNPQEREVCSSLRINDTLVQEPYSNNNDFLLKPFGDDNIDTDLMRLHNLSGPPRFLFTIIEETKEDLESEDGKSISDNKSRKCSRNRSLSDLLLTVETPYLTPLASPSLFTPPLTPMNSSYYQHGFNPLFESSTDFEFNKIRSSPPPKFKFLQDAEEKLYRRKILESEKKAHKTEGSVQENGTKSPSSNFLKDEEDGSFITIIVDRNKERELNNHHCNQLSQFHSSSSQVLPLASSPTTFRSSAAKKN